MAEFNTRRSTRLDGSVLGNSIGLNADIGGRVAHVWVAREGGLVSTLDLLGDWLTLLVGPEWDGEVPSRRAGSPPVAVERLDAISARGVGLTAAGSLLTGLTATQSRSGTTLSPARSGWQWQSQRRAGQRPGLRFARAIRWATEHW